MKNIPYISFLLLLAAFLASCTTSRWVVKEHQAVDQSDYEILDQQKFLVVSNSLTPEDPVFKLDLKSYTTYKYSQKMLVQRSIQDYRLRPGFVLLGLAGAAASFYAANSGRFSSGSAQSITLNAVGVLLGVSGFVNLKPQGEPRSVGEEQYLKTTGSVTQKDTVDINAIEESPAEITVTYRETTVFKDNPDRITNGELRVPLGTSFNDLNITGNDPGSFDITIHFQDSTYQYRYPVSSVLQPYARITTEVTPLRSTPEIDPQNMLANLARGSQIQVNTVLNEQWLNVQYGNFQSYIANSDADIHWRSADFSDDTQIVTVPHIPFGNIAIESNIPVLRNPVENAHALIVTNESYGGNLPTRTYTHRDGKLMEAYLKKALGYSDNHVHHLTDVHNAREIWQALNKIRSATNSNTEIAVYIAGYGSLEKEDGLQLMATDSAKGQKLDHIPLQLLYDRIAVIPSAQTVVISDIDFSRSASGFNEKERNRLRDDAVSSLIDKETTSVIFGNEIGQPSRLYQSGDEDRKHHIMPYFFARALQQRRTTVAQIFSLLKQNISYTSRRLHDRPQSPVLLGDRSVSFTSRQ